MAVRKWVWVVVGIAGVLALAMIAIVGAGIFLVVRHFDIEDATGASADREFAQVRARYPGQEPFYVIENHRLKRRSGPKDKRSHEAPQTLHVMAWDADDGKLVRVEIPFWLLRLKSRGSVSFPVDGTAVDFDRLNITVEDLERLGPGLIVDHRTDEGDRVLIWSD